MVIFIKTIGIIMRNFQENNKKFIGTRKDLFRKLYVYNVKVIGIPVDNDYAKTIELVNECDGIILSGGDNFIDEDFLLVKYLHKNNIPTLGICLGMQTMARCFSDLEEVDVVNHKLSDSNGHYINIYKDTLLYKIMKTDRIFVNSRHKSAIIDTNLCISSRAEDNIIEAVEDSEKKFFLGVEWHPESLADLYSKKLFDYFIDVCNK